MLKKNSDVMDRTEGDDAAQIWGHDEFQFQGQRPDEKVMLVRNQHPVVFLKFTIGVVVSLVLPFFLVGWFDGRTLLWLMVIYFGTTIFLIWRRVYTYRSSIMILSSQRIINLKQSGLFSRTINEAELSRIQDVSSEIKGPLQTAFQFGTVTVRTASNDTKLLIENIIDPYGTQQAIVRALKDVQ